MRKMKVAALMLATAVVFTACSKKDDDTQQPSPTPTEMATPTPEATPEPTPDASGDNQGEDTDPTVVFPEVSEELDKIHKKVVETFGENYIPDTPYDKTAISELFGVSEDWYDYAIAEGSMISLHVDTFIAIHATEGNLENVQNAINNYRNVLVEDTHQYPMNQLKIQGSKVFTSKDYVFFVMLGNIEDETEYDKDEDIIAEYEKLNQNTIDAITSVLGE